MRKLSIWLILWGLLSFQSAHGQFKEAPPRNLPHFDDVFWHWGYYFGVNFFDFKIDYKTPFQYIRTVNNYGFNVGLISDFRLGRMWNLRLEPGIYTMERTLYFHPEKIEDPQDRIRRVKSNYLSVPLYLKFSALRNGNMRPYITGGLSYNYNLTAFERSVNDNSAGRFRMKRQVVMAHVGVGIEMYMYYFKFTPSIRGVFALTNELVPDNDPKSPWTGNLESVKTRGVYIVFTFE